MKLNSDLRAPLAALAIVLLLGVAGCQTYLDDAASRTPGEVTDDLTILTLIKTRLLRDEDVRGLRINVDVSKGVVTLSGKVRTEAERQRAVEVAKAIPSVVRVVDNLVVRI
ncbi:MAG: BON domain-containing protein [Gammaproteobacteria bacterium]|nr:BON domain-containing protein [Gammaproteobacteria bacterium]